MSNSDNPKKGKEFQEKVLKWFETTYNKPFAMEKKIAIGNPKKDHKFDIVSYDDFIAIECKCYSWTETGNVPSAKISRCNEAIFYLSFLPDSYDKYLVMEESRHSKRNETLAEYYFRINRHLIGNIKIAEYNSELNSFRIVGFNQ